MGASIGQPSAPAYCTSGALHPGPELGFLEGLGSFMVQDTKTAPIFLLQADYCKTVNIAIAGNSGVGKSLLVNTVRGVGPDDPTWAPVGVVETTREPTWYTFPGENCVRLWDMEGAGGSCSWENYTGNIGLRYFDAVLLLCSTRLTETDLDIVKELREQSVPFFFVRTKLDEDIKNSATDCGYTPEETQDRIRKELMAGGVEDPYLLNARSSEEFDFPRLIRDIAKQLEDLEQPALARARGEGEAPPEEARKAAPGAAGDDDFAQLWGPPVEYPPEPGDEPVETICNGTGHWYWVEDDSYYDYLNDEGGQIVAMAGTKMNGIPEHIYSKRPDGVWECKVKNFWTGALGGIVGQDHYVVTINPDQQPSSKQAVALPGRKLTGKAREYVAGCKLVSEYAGEEVSWQDKVRTTTKYMYRVIRGVHRGEYYVTFENVVKNRRGTRHFKRYPHYRIVNETGQKVVMKTYALASLWPGVSVEASVEPGTHLVECATRDITVERAVFSLPNRKQFTVSQVEPFESICLQKQDFT
mmetsp:Transcript_34113/g.104944  ORF Transcript_34113/g.104944 Transcript_34113/m.104944 type:complete len:527 (-) Transcript_34113:75-1655(-)